MTNRIYMDLDGVILDPSERLYRIYKDLMDKKKTLSKNRYYDMKRERIPEKDILSMTLKDTSFATKYEKSRLHMIENEEYLRYDAPYPDARRNLRLLSKRYDIILVSRRRSRKRLLEQLENHDIKKYFESILCTSRLTKKDLILSQDKNFSKDAIFIGDTEEDILTAKSLAIPVIALSRGMRSSKQLSGHIPDYIVKDLGEASKIVSKIFLHK